MEGQPDDLRRLLDDTAGIDEVASRIAGHRILLVGTGTSWHAAGQGACLLRHAGLDAWPLPSVDFALDSYPVGRKDVVLALTHTGAKRYTAKALEVARDRGAQTIVISGLDAEEGDLRTVHKETSSAYTTSHLGALFRLAQLSSELSGEVGDLESVPGAVENALVSADLVAISPPERLLEFIGGGINQWTALEGALKVREAAYVATEGMGIEQFLHGPSVALRSTDTLVCLDGGGAWSQRLHEIADAAVRSGVAVERVVATDLDEPLSIFPLTVAVQYAALGLAEQLGTNPDNFGRDVPGREPWSQIQL